MTLTNKLAQAANPKTKYQVFLEKTGVHHDVTLELSKFLVTPSGFKALVEAAKKEAEQIYDEASKALPKSRSRFDSPPVYKSYGPNTVAGIERHLVLDVIQNLHESVVFYLLTRNYGYFHIYDGTGVYSGPAYGIDNHIFEIFKENQGSETQQLLFMHAKGGAWTTGKYTHPIEEILSNVIKKALEKRREQIAQTDQLLLIYEP